MADLVIRDIDPEDRTVGGETYAEAIERIFNLPVEVVGKRYRITPASKALRTVIKAAWAFLDPITAQDYVGEKVDVEIDDVVAFRRVLYEAGKAVR